MILDQSWRFSNNQAITVTTFATNYVDLGPAARDIGGGSPLYINIHIGTTFTPTAGSDTLTIGIVTDVVASFTALPDIIASTKAMNVALSELNANHDLSIVIPRQQLIRVTGFNDSGFIWRYLTLLYTVGGGPFTTGNITAEASLEPRSARLVHADNVP